MTVLVPSYQDPEFFTIKYYSPFKEMEKNHPGLKIRYEPYSTNDIREIMGYFELLLLL